MIAPADRHQFVEDVASAFPGTEFTKEHDGDLLGVAWQKNELNAGAGIDAEQAWVFFSDATAPVDSAHDAIGLLQAIFEDLVVAVAAYEDGVWVAYGLANAEDLHRPPHLLVPFDPKMITRVNELHIRSWSGVHDGVRRRPQSNDQ